MVLSAKHDAGPLSALKKLDDHRGAIDLFDAPGDVVGLPRVYRGGHAEIVTAEDLEAPQFVARASNGLRFVQAVNAHHLELPHDRQSKKRNGRPDTRDDGIDGADGLPLIEQFGFGLAYADVELQGVQHPRLVPAPLGRLYKGLSAVERRLPR